VFGQLVRLSERLDLEKDVALNDSLINSAHALLANSFSLAGFRPTYEFEHRTDEELSIPFLTKMRKSVPTSKFLKELKDNGHRQIQPLFTHAGHYIAVTNIHATEPVNHVFLYDSLSLTPDACLRHQICAVFRMPIDCTYIKVTWSDVERQRGVTNCGIFTIAYSRALCAGVDPSTLCLDQTVSFRNMV
jgi:hypothetical protein